MIVSNEAFSGSLKMALLLKRKLILQNNIDGETVDYFIEGLEFLTCEDSNLPVNIIIGSSGGSAEAGLRIYDVVKNSKVRTIGTVESLANSMASIVLQGCNIREIYPHANILIHSVDITRNIYDLKNRLENVTKKASYFQNEIENILQQRTKISREEIKKIMDMGSDGKNFSAQEAFEKGLVDIVV